MNNMDRKQLMSYLQCTTKMRTMTLYIIYNFFVCGEQGHSYIHKHPKEYSLNIFCFDMLNLCSSFILHRINQLKIILSSSCAYFILHVSSTRTLM